ncbi:methylated-DNA--[protein]-cysteine S-methyltransferase [Kitasatospora sp. NPDC059571]|uniref:methylated-DNA--[protein]-cysteine S-methyltransferase n=1 Tax=Kitasatospora sp. NPDC059571 TaxID=3346871 RepID=UPI003680BC79
MSPTWFTVVTPLPTGPMSIAVTAQGVLAAAFTPAERAALPPGPELPDPASDRRAVAVRTRLDEYFAGRRRALDLPVDWGLTGGVQRTVLTALHREVGFGRTISYGELADLSGAFASERESRGLAARAVGSIIGSNPLSLLVPTHRVVAAGGLGGFGGGDDGMAAKRWLLTLEGHLEPTLDWSAP